MRELLRSTYRDPYRQLGAMFKGDPARRDRLTIGASITSARDALGGAVELTGSGVQLDTVNTLNGKPGFALGSSIANTLRTTTAGPTGAQPWSLTLAATITAPAPSDVGSLLLFGQTGQNCAIVGGRSAANGNRVWGGGFSPIGLRFTSAALTLPATVHAAMTYDGTTCRFWIDGQLIAPDTIAFNLAQGFGITPGSNSFPPPAAIYYRFGAFLADIGQSGVRKIVQDDTATLGIFTPSQLWTQGDATTSGLNILADQAWPAVATPLINTGRYEAVVLRNVAVSSRTANGLTIASDVNTFPARARRAAYLIVLGNTDFRIQDRTLQQVKTDLSRIASDAAAGGFRPVFGTILPYVGQDSRRSDINAWLVAGGSGYECPLNWDEIPEASLTGNPTWYQDGVNQTAALHALQGAYAAPRLPRFLA